MAGLIYFVLKCYSSTHIPVQQDCFISVPLFLRSSWACISVLPLIQKNLKRIQDQN